MDKLFSLFVRYSLVPEQEFIMRASKAIYSMAELADSQKVKDIKVRSQPQNLSITRQLQKITLTSEPQLRQLFYQSTLSGMQRYSIVGSKWVNNQDEELEETIKHDLTRLIK